MRKRTHPRGADGSRGRVVAGFGRVCRTRPPRRPAGTLRVNHNASDYEYVDPQKCYDTGCAETALAHLAEPLPVPGDERSTGQARLPRGAPRRFAVSKDGKTYTFTIRKGQKASNGKTVTPQWFVHAFERTLSPKMGDAASARSGASAIVGPIVVGAQAFYEGKASKITGLTVEGRQADHQAARSRFPTSSTCLR